VRVERLGLAPRAAYEVLHRTMRSPGVLQNFPVHPSKVSTRSATRKISGTPWEGSIPVDAIPWVSTGRESLTVVGVRGLRVRRAIGRWEGLTLWGTLRAGWVTSGLRPRGLGPRVRRSFSVVWLSSHRSGGLHPRITRPEE
jgi:hypothetical protein